LLILLSLTYRGQDNTHDATMYYTAKTSMLSMAEWIEQDFKNIGSGHNPPSTSIISLDTTGATKNFTFWAQVEQDSSARTVRYEWLQDGTADLDSATVPVYTVRRMIDGTITGWSNDTVTNFRIKLLQADSTNVTALTQTRQVHVFVKAVSPLGVGDLIEETTWSKIFRPVNLTRPAP
jgi:hypothetical protein